MEKRPNGRQQMYDFATMHTQLKLFVDPPANPDDPQQGGDSGTESEDELELWELRRKGLGLRDLLEPDGKDRTTDPNDAQQHKDRNVLHSKMKACLNMPKKMSSRMEKKRSLKYKTGDVHQHPEGMILLIVWTQIAQSLSQERGS